MERNRIKIISNKSLKTISFYIQNENHEWMPVDNSSPLSRKEYTKLLLTEKVEKILSVINDFYNIGNRGIDICFEGADDEFASICSVLKQYSNINILCEHGKSKIVVAGKIKSGKSTFIEGFRDFNGINYSKTKNDKYVSYVSTDGSSVLHELDGIDLGEENIKVYEKTIENIISEGITVYIYCCASNKIETAEEKIIMDIKSKYPDVKVLILLTSSIEDDAALIAEQISKRMNGIRVIPVLAKDMRTRQGIIPSFGMDLVNQYIYGGK